MANRRSFLKNLVGLIGVVGITTGHTPLPEADTDSRKLLLVDGKEIAEYIKVEIYDSKMSGTKQLAVYMTMAEFEMLESKKFPFGGKGGMLGGPGHAPLIGLRSNRTMREFRAEYEITELRLRRRRDDPQRYARVNFKVLWEEML